MTEADQARRGRGTLAEVLRSLRWASLRLTLRAEEPVHLPPYAGSTFRGAFGHAFKRVACPLRGACETCAHRSVCVYVLVFETEGTGEGSALARGRTAAHPFVLEPPLGGPTDVPPGGEVTLGLTLIGRGIPLAPYFLAACREMARSGVGRGRGRTRLARAVAADPAEERGRVVYDGEADLMAPAVPPWSGADLPASPARAQRVTLEFLTPTRLRQDADLVVQPEFATLATALLRRVSVLAELHCGAAADLDARAVLEPARAVRVTESALRWHDWERYSARQETRMSLGGFVGRIAFEGDLAPWLPLLRVGEVLHVGKGTAFGLGKYRVVEEP